MENHLSFWEVVESLIPERWRLKEMGDWVFCYHPGNDFPDQGWKIHVSATVLNAPEILGRAVPMITSWKSNFKFLKDVGTLAFRNSRAYDRGGSGKFITIYPPNLRVFKGLLSQLYDALKDMEGPYILSDMRYRDCKVLYYRYGGFVLKGRVDVSGRKIPIILTPEGKPYDDLRLPYYSPPPWVEDPFGNESIRPPKEVVLKRRYRITAALQFSNNGGVYEAVDITGRKVLIKEARPFVSMDESGTDAVALLKKEYDVLKRMEGTGITPEAYDLFEEWEHWFLVEEWIEGLELRSIVAVESPILNPNATDEDRRRYMDRFLTVIDNIASALETFHSRGIVVGDISPNNVLVHPESLEVKFVDFESSYIVGENRWYNVFTPGMGSPQYLQGNRPTYEDDYYAFGQLIYSLLFTNNHLFYLAPQLMERFIEHVLYEYRFPRSLKRIILSTIDENPKRRLKPSEAVRRIRKEIRILRKPRKPPLDTNPKPWMDGIVRGILESEGLKLASSFRGLSDLEVAYGSTGTYYVLNSMGFKPPERWLKEVKDASPDDLPPGLYVGLSGIAWALWDMGLQDMAIRVLELAGSHPLLYEDGGMFYGLAGYGLANLKLYHHTEDPRFLNGAARAYEVLLNRTEEEGDSLFVRSHDGRVKYGYGHGGAGISLFLVRLYEATKDDRIKEHSLKFLRHTLRGARKSNGYLSWPNHPESPTLLPYVEYGSAGVVGVLVRVFDILKEEWLLEYIERALPDLERKFAIYSGQLLGLAGLGESLLDVEVVLGKRTKLHRVLEGLKLFAAVQPDGRILYPTDDFADFTHDWGTGSAGVLEFLRRLRDRGRKRLLWDF